MQKIKCLVVDDEDLARTLISKYIERLDYLEMVGQCSDPITAINWMATREVDLLFLDIQMPEMKGTDLMATLSNPPQVIFTTAYSEYAMESYELEALDYLLKPIRFDRFLKAVQKAQRKLTEIAPPPAVLTLKSGYDLHKVALADICYIEGMKEYVAYHTTGKRIVVLESLKSLELSLPTDQFIRVHKSYIVRMDKVESLIDKELIIGKAAIPIGSSYLNLVREKLFSGKK